MKNQLFEIMESFSSLGIGSMKYQCEEFELELYSDKPQDEICFNREQGQDEEILMEKPITNDFSNSSHKENNYKVLSPLVGIFYSRPSPESESFVKVGDKVEEGDVLCIMEAMKMFNEIKAPVSGKIAKIHCQDEELVGFDQTIFEIEIP